MSTENTTTVIPPAQVGMVASKQPIAFGSNGARLATLEDAHRFATAVSKSGFAPKGFDSPEAIMIALQMGAEVGLAPMQALQNIAVINGKPAIYGDAALALVRASGLMESYSQSIEGEGESMVAIVTVKRTGEEPLTQRFGSRDAKGAGLWGKSGPWSQYPSRMMIFRARSFALRDAFGDVLKGLRIAEEVQDMEPLNVTPRRSRLDSEVAS